MKILPIILFTIVCHSFSPSKPQPRFGNIKGSVYYRLTDLKPFTGYKELAGLVIEPTEDNYCLAYISKLNYAVVVFEKCIKPGTKPQFRLLDTVLVGRVKANQTILLGQARQYGRNNDRIIALVDIKLKGNYFKTVYKAWIANKATGKLKRISVKGIDCCNDGED